jgi:serine/threonine protein kinase
MSLPEESTGTQLPQSEIEGGGGDFSFEVGQCVGRRRFRLERGIGRGRMGVVWKAFDEQTNETVALKFLSEKISGNPATLAAVRREVIRSHSLSHRHIVRTHDLYAAAGEPAFISMEYVEGPNLHAWALEREKRSFAWTEVWLWLRHLCDALSYAHSRGIIHRDLRPANLMLDSRGALKLADFGLAAAVKFPGEADNRLAEETVACMSPQQLAGAPAALTDDVYSVGACLFELLAGVPVFRGSGISRQIKVETAPSLFATLQERGIKHAIPEEIEELILQCLSKNPQQRPQSAKALLEMAGGSLEDGETDEDHSKQPSAGKSGAQRRRRMFVSGVVVAGLLLGGGLTMVLRKPVASSNLDLKLAPVRSSSFEPPNVPERAFDGVHRVVTGDHYRWVSGAFTGDRSEWIAVDLGKDMQLLRVTIDWELAFARDFSVRTRTSAEEFVADPAQWTQRGLITGFEEKNIMAVNDSESIEDAIFDFEHGNARVGAWMSADQADVETAPVVARHVMINLTARGKYNPGVYSIREIVIAAKPAGKAR